MLIKWGQNERGVLSGQERGFAPSVTAAVARWLRAEKIISGGWETLGAPHTQSLFVLWLLEGVFSCVTLFVSVSYNHCTRQIIGLADTSDFNHSKASLSQSANLIKKTLFLWPWVRERLSFIGLTHPTKGETGNRNQARNLLLKRPVMFFFQKRLKCSRSFCVENINNLFYNFVEHNTTTSN